MQYVDGCVTGDVELAKKAFHKDAVMYGYLNGDLCAGSIEALYGAIGQLGADSATKSEVDVMEIAVTPQQCVSSWKIGTVCGLPTSIHW